MLSFSNFGSVRHPDAEKVSRAVQLVRHSTPERAIKFFTLSNIYLASLFAAIAVDTLVRSI